MKPLTYALIAALTGIVSANKPLPSSAFQQNNGQLAALSSAPLYHFGRPQGLAPCYPSSAVLPDNSGPSAPSPPDLGIPPLISRGCPPPGAWAGRLSPGNPFPVYYTITSCSPEEYRIGYSTYFSHDSGHERDWENVVVVWRSSGEAQGGGEGGGMMWKRDRILVGQHGGWQSTPWKEVPETVDAWDERARSDRRGGDHPKVFVGAWRHAVFLDRFTKWDGAWGLSKWEFRSDDWVVLPREGELVEGGVIKSEFDFGKADTNPATLRKGAWRDMCNAK